MERNSRVDPAELLVRAAAGGRRDRAFCGLEEQAKVVRHVPGSAVPLRRPLRECLLADPFQFLGDRVVGLPRWTRLSGCDLLHDLHDENHLGMVCDRSTIRREPRPG